MREQLELMNKTSTIIERETYRSLINRVSMYVDGVFSFMNRHTKVDLKNTLKNYDLSGMPKPVKPVYMFLILDLEYTRMRKDLNRKMLIVDEAWSLLEKAEEAGYIFEIVKTSRKFNLSLLLITQEVADLLENKAGRAVLANTSFTLLLRQKPAVIRQVVDTFQLSVAEKDALLSAKVGEGILIVENDHSEIKIIASEKEHEFITTNADEIVNGKTKEDNKTNNKEEVGEENKEQHNENSKEQQIAPENISDRADNSDTKENESKAAVSNIAEINIDLEKGIFRKRDLNEFEIDYLLQHGYIVSSHVPLGGGQREDYLLYTSAGENTSHFFLMRAVREYLNKFTPKVEVFDTANPDIVFTADGNKYAIEIETGVHMDKRKDRIEEKVVFLNKKFGNRWFFVVTKSEYAYKYCTYGKTYTRKNVEKKINSIFKNPPKSRPEENAKSAKNKCSNNGVNANSSSNNPDLSKRKDLGGRKMGLPPLARYYKR